MPRFSFGKNWSDFVRSYFSEERVSIAQKHILEFLGVPDLKGKYFLDIGCGSGLHSLAAARAGAGKIVSFDLDPYSVETTRKIREMHGNQCDWEILEGSILDRETISKIPPADIVYSWGVLHHTGKMWQAVENAAALIKSGGLFYIALYVTTPRSAYWEKIKRKYNDASGFVKKTMELQYILFHLIIPYLLKFKDPLDYMMSYKNKRGMSYLADVKDWLGGYPYEHARIEEVFRFCRDKLGLELVNIKTGEGNIEYLFRKNG